MKLRAAKGPYQSSTLNPEPLQVRVKGLQMLQTLKPCGLRFTFRAFKA